MCVCVCVHMLSHIQLFTTPWTVSLSMEFSRQEYWSGLPCPPPGNLSNLGIETKSLTSPALADEFFTTIATWEALYRGFVGGYLSVFETDILWVHCPH